MERKKMRGKKIKRKVNFFLCCLDEEKIDGKKMERKFSFVWMERKVRRKKIIIV